jgi:AsmA protein
MKIVVGLIVVVVLLLGVILSLPFLIDLNKYQDHYKPLIEDALNRNIQLQDIRLTIWPRIGARVGGFTVLDDPSFSSGPFASLTSLDVGVKLMPLLSGKVEVEEITLRDPLITVIKNKSGVMNVSTIGPKGPAQPSAQEPGTPPQPEREPLQALALLAVEHVSIDGGRLTYRDLSTTPVTEYEVQNLELLLKAVHLGETPTIHLSATVQPYNLPVTLDGSAGPLVEALEVKQYDFTLGLGKIALFLKGSLVGGMLDAALSAPLINTADLPVSLPLTKPVQVKDLRVVAKAPYPLKQGVSAMELADVTDLGLALVMGKSSVNVKGTVLGGQANFTISSPSVNSADLPVAVPLAKPIEINNLHVSAKTRVPFNPAATPLDLADVSDLSLGVALGKSVMTVKGRVLGGQANLVVSSPVLNTADLPIETGVAQPIELKNVQLNADLKGQEARLSNLSFHVFNGQAKAQGVMSLGSAAPPFEGKVTIHGVQLGPALQAVSPESKVSVSGTAAMNIALAGRGFSMPELTRALEGSGHMQVKDGKIEGVDLMEEAVTLLKVAGVSLDRAKATAFSTIETDFMIKQGIVNVRKLLLDSHDFQAAGNGTVGFDQALNLAVNMNLSRTLSQKLAGSAPIAKVALKDGRLRLPLLVTGTTQNPSYRLDMKGLTGKVQEQVQEQLKGTVEGLLQGTTKPSDLKKEGQELLKGLFGK